MSQVFDPVFGDWFTEASLGTGTDGKAFLISRKSANGTTERAVLKTIRVGDYRSEKKSFNHLDPAVKPLPEEDLLHEKIISNIIKNIQIMQKADNGKHFVRYEAWEKRKTSDGKGTLILIRLEEMRSLSQLLDSFSLTTEETIRLGIAVCRSLVRCRDFGYIYPNIKPENILFDKNGVCKLGDFGSFSCLEPSKTSIAYKRTQYYMAPEFIKTGKINCTVDTYSLGLILYMLINRGRLPFTEPYPQNLSVGSFDRSMQNRLQGVPFPRPALYDEGLCGVIEKACAAKPEERYFSPKQMLADLESVLQRKPRPKMEFEDVYSVSDPSALNEEPQTIEPEPEPQEPLYPEEVTPTVSLKEEIQIPDIKPSDYAEKPQRKKRRAAPVPRVEAPKKRTPKAAAAKKNASKRFFVLMILAIIVLVLLIVSVTLKLGGETETTMQSGVPAMLQILSDGGEIPWPMI